MPLPIFYDFGQADPSFYKQIFMTRSIVAAICTPEEYAENLKLDFSSIVRKKGSIDYIPYAHIIRSLHQNVPGCTYGFLSSGKHGEIIFYTSDNNAYVRPYLTRLIQGDELIFDSAKKEMVQPIGETYIISTPPGFFPISNMAARHRAIANPDIRQVDNCLRRAIAKEIGMHTGIGMALWADSDPYDEVEDSAVTFDRNSTPQTNGNKPQPPNLNDVAEKVGLDEHGKKTIALCVKVDSFNDIPDEIQSKVFQLISSPDNVTLFNRGRNTKGKIVNPKPHVEEVNDIVNAFKESTTSA